jgi:hypothetical protein
MAQPTDPDARAAAPPDDPYEAHFHREPLPRAAVRVVVLDRGGDSQAEAVGAGLIALLGGRNRKADLHVVSVRDCGGIGPAIERGADDTDSPLVLVTTAREPWTDAHLKPLLDAIDKCDHVVGRRPGSRLGRWLATLRWRIVFGVPVLDVFSPCGLHRREALAAIPLQSASSFAEVELLAKATFLGQLIDEVAVPALEAPSVLIDPADSRRLFRHPCFRREPDSTPAEEAQGEEERHDGPGGQDDQRGGDLGDPGPLQDDPS